MRFEFCGKLDCPDWILVQLFYASRLDLPRFKLICESVADTILADGGLDEELFDKLELDDDVFDLDDARACFGAVNYIVTNACLYQVSTPTLNLELQQLGLPSEHCQSLCEVLNQSFDQLKEHL